jgi:2-oxoglutarate dehydrogenase E2 component (dihydrolipoamide succinyltransferase)
MLVDVLIPTIEEPPTESMVLWGWRLKIGDPVVRDETIVEVSALEVDVELPSPATGTLAEVLVGDGGDVMVGQVIGRLLAVEHDRSA